MNPLFSNECLLFVLLVLCAFLMASPEDQNKPKTYP
jgi:hypothetical protein